MLKRLHGTRKGAVMFKPDPGLAALLRADLVTSQRHLLLAIARLDRSGVGTASVHAQLALDRIDAMLVQLDRLTDDAE